MSHKLGRRLAIGGLVGLVLGTGPLLACIVLAPKSNAVGPGLLAFFTFWPSVACTAAGGVLWVLGRRDTDPNTSDAAGERPLSAPIDRAA